MKLVGYRIDTDGYYNDGLHISSENDFSDFLISNVTQYHELRIIDKDDYLVMHVINQTLVFPLPEHGNENNKWDAESNMFVNITS
jgi:hypothetical protein